MALGLRPLGLWAAEPHLPLAAHGTLGLAGALLETRNGFGPNKSPAEGKL